MQLFKLQFFADGAEGSVGGEGAAETGAQTDVQAEVTDTRTDEQKLADYNALVKGEYKDFYKKDVEKAVKSRFKDHEALSAKAKRADSAEPLLEMLAARYGLQDTSDVQGIIDALDNDDAFYIDEAERNGMTVEQYRKMERLQRDSTMYHRMMRDQAAQQKANETYQGWIDQAEQLQNYYPDFNLDNEVNNEETGERFVSMLSKGIDVKTAYEIIHMDELMGGAMAKTANVVREKTYNEIRTRGMRPSENGGAGNAAAKPMQLDPAKMTKKQRDEYARRAMRGETITFQS